MGYKPNRRVFKLKFEDDEYDGLVVKARSVKLGSFFDVAGLAKLDSQNVRPEDIEQFEKLFATFADALVEWNLEDDDGNPVPPTLDGIKGEDADFMMPIIKAWFDGIAKVSSPLGQPSSNGARSLEASIPMEARS